MIPLIHCWSVTIHKVQGLTLDRAVIELDCFGFYMEYVALSRLKTLSGLAI
jgi:ATP-dependent exoDNAse (exonuclease V) alpha subunit